MPELLQYDIVWSRRLVSWGSVGWRHRLAWLIARTGDLLVWVIINAILFWQGDAAGWPLFWTIVGTAVIVFVLKGLVRRRRPGGPGRAVGVDKFSFPSGHGARAMAVAITLSFAFPTWTVCWLLWALLVCVARVMHARHFLSDVLGGISVGLLYSLLLQLLL